jgi:hypothetical protein
MAKRKTYAVTVEWTVSMQMLVEARRPNGAAERALTEEGWRESTQYRDDECVPFYPPKDARVTRVREAF